MNDERTPLPLTPEELRLIHALREIPDSPIRDRVVTVVHELVQLATEPRCLEAQADGVPCGNEKTLCEACSRVFERVRGAVDRSFPAPLSVLPVR
jgi:hypothetical protein